MQDASFSQKQADREYLSEPQQPDPAAPIPNLSASRCVGGVRYFPPVAEEGCDILFVQIAVLPEEASQIHVTAHGAEIPRKPGLGTGPAAQIIRDIVNRFPNFHDSRVGFASVIPWLLPKTRRYRPNKDEAAKGADYLRAQVQRIKPKVIVALGMPAFKALSSLRISYDDARYGWFSTDDGNIPLYCSFPSHLLLTQPWTQDAMITDLQEVYRMAEARATRLSFSPVNIQVIASIPELLALIDYWRSVGAKCFSVDCEWGRGGAFVDCDVRSIQFAWNNSDAAYLRFYDEHNKRYLADSIREAYLAVGAHLEDYFQECGATFIGHHFSADSPVMEYWLGITTRGRCVFDSEYALQVADEYASRGLENLALRYTDFGRYDMDLVMWKRANPGATADGYHLIPDSIMIPYACKDVLTVWRSR